MLEDALKMVGELKLMVDRPPVESSTLGNGVGLAIEYRLKQGAMGNIAAIDKPDFSVSWAKAVKTAFFIGAIGLGVTAFSNAEAGGEPVDKPAPAVAFHQNHLQ